MVRDAEGEAVSADLSDLDIDDDVSRVPRTPTPAEVPALVRELARVQSAHSRAIQAMRRLVWAVVLAVLVGSLGVIGSVAAAAWGLGGRMERIESLAWRVERLERAEERAR